MNTSPSHLKKLLLQIEAENAANIGHGDHLFLTRIFGDGLQKYTQRLMAIGFSGQQKILDAGCGFGQWSLSLSSINNAVECCDVSPLRIRFLKQLAEKLNIKNLNAQVSGIEVMPYPDHCFDAVFCYGVIFLTNWRKSLKELVRVLKPGGKIYVNANGLGWYIFLWKEEHNKADDYDPKFVAARAFSDTLIYDRDGIYELGMNLIVEPSAIKNELENHGLKHVIIDSEGCLHIDHSAPIPKPFFNGEYYGEIGVYEIVATKA